MILAYAKAVKNGESFFCSKWKSPPLEQIAFKLLKTLYYSLYIQLSQNVRIWGRILMGGGGPERVSANAKSRGLKVILLS